MSQHTERSHGFQQVVSASTVKGKGVQNLSGESLGNIEDVMLDATRGRVAYAVLSFGGFLGVGDKLFAVPWEALTYSEDFGGYRMDADKELLENAPGFDKDNWPNFADESWSRGVHTHYGFTPYWDR
jgi:sporulation protein YlmC with PRC-barrel domain